METLFVAAVKSLALLAFAWIVTRTAPRISAAQRYFAWMLALIAGVLLPLIPPILPRWEAPVVLRLTALPAAGAVKPAALDWLPVIWAAGCVVVLIRFLAATVWSWRMARRTTPFRGVPGRVRESRHVSVPFTRGVLRPSIIIPTGARQWPAGRLRAVLAHERAHIARRDCLTFLVARVACAIYWFNPLVWWAARQMLAERERACDDRVLAAGVRPIEFAHDLLEVARDAGRIGWAAAAAAHPSQLEGRLRSILNPQLCRGTLTAASAVLITIAVCAVAIPIAALSSPAAAAVISDRPAGKVYRVADDVSRPAVVRKVEPEYTPEAKAAGLEGMVMASVVIGSDGKAHDVRIEQHLGLGLDEKACEAIAQWRFRPAMRRGRPVNVRATIEINFRLF